MIEVWDDRGVTAPGMVCGVCGQVQQHCLEISTNRGTDVPGDRQIHACFACVDEMKEVADNERGTNPHSVQREQEAVLKFARTCYRWDCMEIVDAWLETGDAPQDIHQLVDFVLQRVLSKAEQP